MYRHSAMGPGPHDTIPAAIAASIEETRVVVLDCADGPVDALAAALAIECDDIEDDTHEGRTFVGTNLDGERWAVRVVDPIEEPVVVESTPDSRRESEIAGRGSMGTVRVTMSRGDAEAIVEADGGWSRIVEGADPACYAVIRDAAAWRP